MSFCAGGDHLDKDPISYDEALERIFRVASTTPGRCVRSTSDSRKLSACRDTAESLSLLDAVGRRSSYTLNAPHSTPLTDTSAMDGFAVSASTTVGASNESPVRLRVVDSIAAGDAPCQKLFTEEVTSLSHDICVEIMTGACFPELTMPYLDSVVKIEDVIVREVLSQGTVCRYIELKRPVKKLQHRRPAGSDFEKDEIIVRRGTIVEAKHIAALASLGYTHIQVTADVCKESSRRASTMSNSSLRVGVLSTGSEIVGQLDQNKLPDRTDNKMKQTIPDSNGPYLVSSLRALCPWVAVEYLGVATDNAEELAKVLQKAIVEDCFDIIITSGGVSKGRYDLVKHVVQSVMLDGQIVFHGVKIRPGAPVLFALFDRLNEIDSVSTPCRTVLFGAPGNPLAAAVALRFFVVPYVFQVNSLDLMKRQGCSDHARVSSVKVCIPERERTHKEPTGLKCLHAKPADKTVFWLARQHQNLVGHVELVADQASYKLRGLLEADCWITAPVGLSEVFPGDQLIATSL